MMMLLSATAPTIDKTQALLILLVIGIVNALLRFLPGLIFRGKRQPPRALLVLAKYLPHAVVGMLVIYCMRNTSPLVYPYALPELIASALTALLHFRWHNSLLSIGCGVAAYMLLLQVVF